MDPKHCRGCRDDFYNGKNPLGVKSCWLLPKATLLTRYRPHRDSMPGSKGAFTEMTRPSCYGESGFCFYSKLPEFVKPEDVLHEKTP